MSLPATDERCLALREGTALAVAAGDPSFSRHREEDLTEPCFVRADLAAWLEVDDVRVRLAFPSASFTAAARFDWYRVIGSARLASDRSTFTGRSSLRREERGVCRSP